MPTNRLIVCAPVDSISTGDIVTVSIAPDEDVEWIWTTYPDGSRKVTGYNIIKKPASEHV